MIDDTDDMVVTWSQQLYREGRCAGLSNVAGSSPLAAAWRQLTAERDDLPPDPHRLDVAYPYRRESSGPGGTSTLTRLTQSSQTAPRFAYSLTHRQGVTVEFVQKMTAARPRLQRGVQRRA